MEEKVFFTPGDLVTLKQELPFKPIMMVKSVDKTSFRNGGSIVDSKPVLFGITCSWFTTSLEYQEKRFNTKDLVHYESK